MIPKFTMRYTPKIPRLELLIIRCIIDGSGWVWFIPLHNATTSVGVVMKQDLAMEKKKATASTSSRSFYLESIKGARGISKLLENATCDGEVKSASDWSYSASSYGGPYLRIVGDAGAFIDPYFSSGVHLALSGGLSAAISICASLRGDCDEGIAWDWHSHAVATRFSRFLLVVLSATRQIRAREAPIMNKRGDGNFDDAFTIIRPGKPSGICPKPLDLLTRLSDSRYCRCAGQGNPARTIRRRDV